MHSADTKDPAVYTVTGFVLLVWSVTLLTLMPITFYRVVLLATNPIATAEADERCAKCGYDLRGTPINSTACPECGHPSAHSRKGCHRTRHDL